MNVTLAVTAPVATHAIVLAQQPGNGDNGGQGEDFGKSSPVGFLLLLIFLIAVAFLVRSMTKHLKRVPPSFDPEAEATSEQAPTGEDSEETAEPNGKAGQAEKKETSESSG